MEEKMFTLVELGCNLFAVVKASDSILEMPITIHGFIEVSTNTATEDEYYSFFYGKTSKELNESNEMSSLIKSARQLTKESMAYQE